MSLPADAERRIRVSGVGKVVGGAEILTNISLEVEGGSCFGVLGENGSGKTTLLRIMTGLVRPSTGGVEIMGSCPHTCPVSALERLSALIGIPAFYGNMTAYDNLRIFSDIGDPRLLTDAFEEVGLADERNKKAGAYSRGMLQRLGIALALLHNRPFVILDEPTQGVDEAWVEHLGNIFRARAKAGQAFIITSHDFDFVASLCEKIMVLDSGRNVYEGALSGAAEYPYYFVLECEPGERAEGVLKGLDYVHKTVRNGNRFDLVIPKDAVHEAVRELVSAGCKVNECAIKRYAVSDLVRQRKGGA